MDATLGHKSRIYFSGYGYSKQRCQSITSWFMSRFLPRHKVGINIHHRGMKRDDSFGFCDYIDCAYNPREFEIELQSNMGAVLYTKTLLHELVHLRQWIQGTLKLKSGRMYWKGESVDRWDYLNQPHEVEAFELEEKLYADYIYDTTGMWIGDE